MVDSLKDTIVPKSDQLNADDVLIGPITVRIEGVTRGDKEQPVVIAIDGDRQPYKPCKSMRRVLITAWGDNPLPWIGRRMTLFNDPEVKYGGVMVGGIRISHLSGIPKPLTIPITVSRGKRVSYTVQVLMDGYPDDRFEADLPRMVTSIASGKSTFEKVLEYCESNVGKLSEPQVEKLKAMCSTSQASRAK